MTQHKNKRTYPVETLALPPLKMVLVHAENERFNTAAGLPRSGTPTKKNRIRQEIVIRIIEHLTKEQ
jgi:hypothetical protein